MRSPRPTILVVDDDLAITRLVTSFLQKHFGDEVLIEPFHVAELAMQRFERGGIDVLITDLQMPDFTGIDLLRAARDRDACTQTLFITGSSSRTALLEAMELGASDYLLKPLDESEITTLVEEALRRRARWNQALQGTWNLDAENAPVTP